MAISFNTSAHNNANNALSVSITIPAGVLTNDVMLMALSVFNESASTPTISFSGAGGSWTAVPVTTGSNPAASNNGTLFDYGYAYYRVATAGDPGASLTITATGTAATTWITVALASYTGASTGSPIDVAGSAAANASSVTCPAETTGIANDWAIYLGGGGVNGSPTFPGPSGATQRENFASAPAIGAAIFDSNGSVGGSGTSIGGTASFTFQTTNAPTAGQIYGYTIGLAPPGGAAPSGTVQPRSTFPTPRRKLARAVWAKITGQGFVAVAAPVQTPQMAVPARRRPARATVQFVPVTTFNTGHGPAGTVQPLAVPAAAPRRRPARTVTQFTPVTTTNNLHPVAPPTPPALGGGKSMLSRYMRWADL